jgi:hypothetical protein
MDEPIMETGTTSSHPERRWTVMVYLAGDNELNDDMITALQGLQALAGNPGCNIFAYYATTNLPLESVLYDFRVRKDPDHLKCYETQCLGSVAASTLGNSADIRSLIRFVKGCREEVQTDHNVLILSGHSDAFLGRSLLQDETSLKVMKFSELREALQRIKVNLNKRLDILGFDSCAMGMVEIAFELRRFAQVLITPQDFTPSSGWNYKEMLGSLAGPNPVEDPVVHARHFVNEYIHDQTDFTVGGRSVEISACRLDGDFETLVQKIKALADLLRVELPPVQKSPQDENSSSDVPSTRGPGMLDPPSYDRDSGGDTFSKEACVNLNPITEDEVFGDDALSNQRPGMLYSRMVDLILCSHWFGQTHMQDQAVDLRDFCFNMFLESEKLRRHIAVIKGDLYCTDATMEGGEGAILFNKLNEIRDLCLQILLIMSSDDRHNRIVIHKDHAGIQHQFSFGLSIFFPWSRLAFVLSYGTYKQLAFVKGPGKSWLSLINRFTAETIRQDFKEVLGEDPETELIRLLTEVAKEVPGEDQRAELIKLVTEVGKYNPPGKGALASFREKFGKVKNYPLTWDEPECQPDLGSHTSQTDV